jgi:phage gp36-like protein
MAYTTVADVRRLSKLLDTDAISDGDIEAFIDDSQAVLDLELGRRYKVPLDLYNPDVPVIVITATKYLTASLIISEYFSERSYNQETQIFYNRYEVFARNIIKEIKEGKYHNSGLAQQDGAKNLGRLMSVTPNTYLSTFECNLRSLP